MVKRLCKITASKRKKIPTVLFNYNLRTTPAGVTSAEVHHLGKSYILDRSDIEKAILFYIEENKQ